MVDSYSVSSSNSETTIRVPSPLGWPRIWTHAEGRTLNHSLQLHPEGGTWWSPGLPGHPGGRQRKTAWWFSLTKLLTNLCCGSVAGKDNVFPRQESWRQPMEPAGQEVGATSKGFQEREKEEEKLPQTRRGSKSGCRWGLKQTPHRKPSLLYLGFVSQRSLQDRQGLVARKTPLVYQAKFSACPGCGPLFTVKPWPSPSRLPLTGAALQPLAPAWGEPVGVLPGTHRTEGEGCLRCPWEKKGLQGTPLSSFMYPATNPIQKQRYPKLTILSWVTLGKSDWTVALAGLLWRSGLNQAPHRKPSQLSVSQRPSCFTVRARGLPWKNK